MSPASRRSRLDLRRAGHEDAMAEAVRVLEPRPPDRGLPDARGPFEDQRRRRRPVEEPTDGLHLGLATKDLRDGHASERVTAQYGSTTADPTRAAVGGDRQPAEHCWCAARRCET